MAWPGEEGARGLRRLRARERLSGFPPRRQRLSASPQNARRSASHQRICTHARAFAARNPRARPPPPVAAREAQTLGGRVRKGRGAAAPPRPAPRGGARLALGPAAPGKGLQPAGSRSAALESLAGLWRAGSAPLLPPSSSGGRYPASGNPGFPGRGPGPEKTVRERAQPLGSAEHVVLVTRSWNRIARCGDPFSGYFATSAKGAVGRDSGAGHHLRSLSSSLTVGRSQLS